MKKQTYGNCIDEAMNGLKLGISVECFAPKGVDWKPLTKIFWEAGIPDIGFGNQKNTTTYLFNVAVNENKTPFLVSCFFGKTFALMLKVYLGGNGFIDWRVSPIDYGFCVMA